MSDQKLSAAKILLDIKETVHNIDKKVDLVKNDNSWIKSEVKTLREKTNDHEVRIRGVETQVGVNSSKTNWTEWGVRLLIGGLIAGALKLLMMAAGA